MTENLLKTLFLGSKLSDEEAKNIPYYRQELHFHVLTKNLQVGCIVGALVGGLRGLYKGRTLKAMLTSAYKGQKVGCAVLSAAAPLMVEMAIRNATQEAIYDRSYRIRNNTNQMTTDRFAFCGAVLGSGASLVIGKGLLPGLFSGFAIGTLSAGAYNTTLKK